MQGLFPGPPEARAPILSIGCTGLCTPLRSITNPALLSLYRYTVTWWSIKNERFSVDKDDNLVRMKPTKKCADDNKSMNENLHFHI